MLTDTERAKLVERFLTGTLDAEELRKFTDMLDHEPQLRRDLERESGIDALLHSAGSMTLADHRFTEALDRSIGRTATVHPAKTGWQGHWVQLYALAASLLLAVSGVYIFTMKKGLPAAVASTVRHHEASSAVAGCHSGKEIYHLSKRALFLSEEGSRVRVLSGEAGAVNVVVSQGNVCFDVADGDADVITVATPHAAVILSKRAVTRVVVTELETEVAVLEGTAEVVHRYNREHPAELAAGGTVFADFDAVQVAQRIAPEVCESRTNMFKAYVSWVQKQAHG